jgi:hypothetical protein
LSILLDMDLLMFLFIDLQSMETKNMEEFKPFLEDVVVVLIILLLNLILDLEVWLDVIVRLLHGLL